MKSRAKRTSTQSEKAGHEKSATRLRFLQKQMEADALDAFVVSHLPNIFYLAGFTGSAAFLVVTPDDATLFTDPRYLTQAREEVTAARTIIVRGSLTASVGDYLTRLSSRRIGVESEHLTMAQKSSLDKARRGVRWIPWGGKIEAARAIKDAQELDVMRGAAKIACSSWEEILPLVKPGVLENELAAEVEFRMRRKGASGPAFDTIIASGPRGALPHAHASTRAIGRNELVVFDLGAILRGYSSDLTRTVFVGRAPAEIQRWHSAVLEAQQAARNVLRPGVSAQEVDAAARKVLQRAGLGRHFVHSTGHGLGLEVHELPKLARGEKWILRTGMVVTIEPGVYVEGTGGVRVEDDAVVTQKGAEYLTDANRELIELG